MEEIIKDTYMVALPIVLGYIIWLLKTMKGKRSANDRGTMLLLRCHIIDIHHSYMKKGEISMFAYNNFNEMYEAYKMLGGNGCIAKMKEELDDLRIKTAREEHNE